MTRLPTPKSKELANAMDAMTDPTPQTMTAEDVKCLRELHASPRMDGIPDERAALLRALATYAALEAAQRELAALKAAQLDTEGMLHAAQLRGDALHVENVALKADKARLDWLEREMYEQGQLTLECVYDGREARITDAHGYTLSHNTDLRTAIDTAMEADRG